MTNSEDNTQSEPSGSNLPQNNSNDSNSNNHNNGTNNNNTNTPVTPSNLGTGNNITVSIQYAYPNLNAVGTPDNVAADTTSTPGEETATTTPTSGSNNTTDTSGTGTQPAGNRAGVSFPPGTIFLQFRDVPASNSQERLQTIMSIASELAIRRMADLSQFQQNKGISKENFEALPLIPLKDLDPNVKNSGCSICYEAFVDPELPASVTNSKKRSRDEDENEVDEINDQQSKRPRSGENATDPVPAGHGSVSTAESDTTPNPSVTSATSATPTTNDEEVDPSYDHSAVEVPCHHIFGRECLYKWCKLENTCPLCRHVIAESQHTPTTFDNIPNSVTTTAAFQRIHDMLYNNNGTTTSTTDGAPAGTATSDSTSDNNSTPPTNPPTVSGPTTGTNTSGTTAPPTTSSIIFITPRWYTPPPGANDTDSVNTTAATELATHRNSSTTNVTTVGQNNNSPAATATDNEESTPYERFRHAIGSYFDSLTQNSNNQATPQENTSAGTQNQTNNTTTTSNTRNLDLLAMGNSIRNSLLQRRNVVPGSHDLGAPTLFNSGVASYRTPTGNVSTYHLGANEAYHASLPTSNNNSNNRTTPNDLDSNSNSNSNDDNTTNRETSATDEAANETSDNTHNNN